MADKTSTTYSVSMVVEFTDGDTRTLTQDEPIENTASLIAAINAFNEYAATNNVLIGDKAGGAYSRIKEAKKVTKTQTKFDIG